MSRTKVAAGAGAVRLASTCTSCSNTTFNIHINSTTVNSCTHRAGHDLSNFCPIPNTSMIPCFMLLDAIGC